MRLKTTQTAEDETVNRNVLFRGSLCRNGAVLRQRLKRFCNTDVLGVSALIQIEFLLLDRFEAASQRGRCAGGGELLLRRSGFQLVAGVVRALTARIDPGDDATRTIAARRRRCVRFWKRRPGSCAT